jgi:ABC-2 type transport system permease protein
MKSKTSFITTGILRNDFKSLGWIGGGYLLGLLLSVPLQLIMLYSRAQQNPDIYYRPYSDSYAFLGIFQFNSALQVMLLVLVPILAGIWLFRYLQDDKAADMIHALPVRREILYNTHVLSGLIFLFVPLIITALVSWALVAGLGLPHVSFIKILIWLSVSMLLNLLFFLTSVFTGTFTVCQRCRES